MALRIKNDMGNYVTKQATRQVWGGVAWSARSNTPEDVAEGAETILIAVKVQTFHSREVWWQIESTEWISQRILLKNAQPLLLLL